MTTSTSTFIPLHGNYRGYYTKRPSTRDPRLQLLPSGIFDNKCVLDVGCNEGWVTCEIAQSTNVKEIVGVDIDGVLVRAAWKRRRTVWSLQEPRIPPQVSLNGQKHEEDRISGKRKRKDRASGDEQGEMSSSKLTPSYFPAAFEHMFGPLPIPPSSCDYPATTFPHNVSFRTANWVQDGIVGDSVEKYDVVIAFSLTKWIHLNDGDNGIRLFFQRAYDVLKPGGIFILEPQEWETYSKAKRLDPKLRENAKTLQLRPDEYPRLLMDLGFGNGEHLGTTGKGGFRRSVDLYRKAQA